MQKEQILDEIRRTAQENDGKPLGKTRFERATGIKEYDWQKYWPRFSEVQREAGFAPNEFAISKLGDDFLIESVVKLTRELGRFPVKAEMRIKKRSDPTFPNDSSITRGLGNKNELVEKVLAYCKSKPGYEDITRLLESIPATDKPSKNQTVSVSSDDRFGEVYLFKSGRYYKIGMTKDTVRRGAELRIQLPERMELVHSIQTDDPSGIEAYWHRRFDTKRMNGEWFDLSSDDIRAFKRWRKIF